MAKYPVINSNMYKDGEKDRNESVCSKFGCVSSVFEESECSRQMNYGSSFTVLLRASRHPIWALSTMANSLDIILLYPTSSTEARIPPG